jgi:cell wall-associated NlpC family hydrolase
VAQNDVDVANQAQVAKQQAQTSAARLSALLQQRTAALKKLVASKQQIQAGISQEQAIVSKFQKQLAAEQAAARARALAAKKAAQSNPAPAGPPPGSGSGGGGGPPPPPASGAAAAVRAAYSVLGVPYQWGGSNPQTGFDCSGLTMWSWAHAGVSLPHSSGMQYAMLPHVPASDLQPGDLVFFYTPISHVGIYVGGGMMIHAPHTGSFVSLVPLSYEPGFVGAARP